MLPGDTDIEEEVPHDAAEVPAPVISAPTKEEKPLLKRRLRPAEKWDALSILQRIDVLDDMEAKRMLPPGSVLREQFTVWEEFDSRFLNLHYDTQEKVISYLRKNYADLD